MECKQSGNPPAAFQTKIDIGEHFRPTFIEAGDFLKNITPRPSQDTASQINQPNRKSIETQSRNRYRIARRPDAVPQAMNPGLIFDSGLPSMPPRSSFGARSSRRQKVCLKHRHQRDRDAIRELHRIRAKDLSPH